MKTAADENHWDLIFPRALRWTAPACSLLAFAAAAFILNTMQRYAWRCGEPFRNDFTLYTVCAAIILGTQFLTWNRRSIPLDIALSLRSAPFADNLYRLERLRPLCPGSTARIVAMHCVRRIRFAGRFL
jgi:hypothetical protein